MAGTKTMYAITRLNGDGIRTLVFANQGRFHYATQAEAEKDMELFLPGLRIAFGPTMADMLEVRPVECYEHGDAVNVWFN